MDPASRWATTDHGPSSRPVPHQPLLTWPLGLPHAPRLPAPICAKLIPMDLTSRPNTVQSQVPASPWIQPRSQHTQTQTPGLPQHQANSQGTSLQTSSHGQGSRASPTPQETLQAQSQGQPWGPLQHQNRPDPVAPGSSETSTQAWPAAVDLGTGPVSLDPGSRTATTD